MKSLVLSKRQKLLRKRIVEISCEQKLSHIGSCLNSVDLIDEIYNTKQEHDEFVLSSGHAAVAWYCVLEERGIIPKITTVDCVHPNRDKAKGITVSTGSLGCGLPITVGMAMANKQKHFYCLVSDGETAEGSIWEALRLIADKKIENIHVLISANGWGAYDSLSVSSLKKRLVGFGFRVISIDGHNPSEIRLALKIKSKNKPVLIFAKTKSDQLPFLEGLDAHYYVMRDDYLQAQKILS